MYSKLLLISCLTATSFCVGCSGELSDSELAMAAMLRADSLIANGYCPSNKRDSLSNEMTILLFRQAGRPKGLIKYMKETPGFDTNPAALYGLAVAHSMLEDTGLSREYLEKAIAHGDWHLYLEEEQASFIIFANDLLFPDLVAQSESNYDAMMFNAGQNAVRARERRAKVLKEHEEQQE